MSLPESPDEQIEPPRKKINPKRKTFLDSLCSNTNLSPESRKAVEQLCRDVFKDNNSMIDGLEFREGLLKIEPHLTLQNCSLLLKHVRSYPGACLSQNQFSHLVRVIVSVQQLFRTCDLDRNHVLDQNEIQILFEKLDIPADLRGPLMKTFDTREESRLNRSQILNLVLFVKALYFEYRCLKHDPMSRRLVLQDLSCGIPMGIVYFHRNVLPSFKEFVQTILDAQLRPRKVSTLTNASRKDRPRKVSTLTDASRKDRPLRSKHSQSSPDLPIKQRVGNPLSLKYHDIWKTGSWGNVTPIKNRSRVESCDLPIRTSNTQLDNHNTISIKTENLKPSALCLWQDPSFPCDEERLPLKARGQVVWKRPSAFSSKPRLFIDGVQSGDVVQGLLTDCWFLSSLATLAAAAGNLIQSLFVSATPDQGKYQVKFFKNGQWEVVEIDDRIPCHKDSGKPFFGSCLNCNELWVPIIEKAYAKLHGGYSAIESGSISDALRDLTGHPVELLSINRVELGLGEGRDVLERLWKKLVSGQEKGHLMGCSLYSEVARAEEVSESGVLFNHLFPMVALQENDGARTITLRNPWGKHDCDPSNAIHSPFKELENDGTFFICFEDFVKHFNRVHILRMVEDEGTVWNFKGEWKGVSAGGRLGSSTWQNNPQFLFSTSSSSCRVFVSLIQEDTRYEARNDPRPPNNVFKPIGVYLINSQQDHPYKIYSLQDQDYVLYDSFVNARDHGFEFTANPHTKYVIIPSLYQPNDESRFDLQICSSEKRSECKELTLNCPQISVVSEWSQKTAGGSSDCWSWKSNPQFVLTVDRCVDVVLSIRKSHSASIQTHKQEPVGLYLLVNRDRNSRRLIDPRLPSSDIPRFSEGVYSQTAVVQTGVEYIVVPTTFHPNILSSFELSIVYGSPDAQLSLTPVLEWKTQAIDSCWSVSEDRAGGCKGNPLWERNPRFLLRSFSQRPQVTFNVALLRTDPTCKEPFGFYIFRLAPDENVLEFQVGVGVEAFRKSRFSSFNIVTEQFVLDPTLNPTTENIPFLILPTTFKSGVQTVFRIEILCTEPEFSFEEIK